MGAGVAGVQGREGAGLRGNPRREAVSRAWPAFPWPPSSRKTKRGFPSSSVRHTRVACLSREGEPFRGAVAAPGRRPAGAHGRPSPWGCSAGLPVGRPPPQTRSRPRPQPPPRPAPRGAEVRRCLPREPRAAGLPGPPALGAERSRGRPPHRAGRRERRWRPGAGPRPCCAREGAAARSRWRRPVLGCPGQRGSRPQRPRGGIAAEPSLVERGRGRGGGSGQADPQEEVDPGGSVAGRRRWSVVGFWVSCWWDPRQSTAGCEGARGGRRAQTVEGLTCCGLGIPTPPAGASGTANVTNWPLNSTSQRETLRGFTVVGSPHGVQSPRRWSGVSPLGVRSPRWGIRILGRFVAWVEGVIFYIWPLPRMMLQISDVFKMIKIYRKLLWSGQPWRG